MDGLNDSSDDVSHNSDRFVFGKLEPSNQPYAFSTKKANFQTFTVPSENINELTPNHVALGKELIRAFRTDGLLQIEVNNEMANICKDAISESKAFFLNTSLVDKRKLVNDLSYSGYIASGQELTDGKADGSEIFTITPDIGLNDERFINKWPCHGPGEKRNLSSLEVGIKGIIKTFSHCSTLAECKLQRRHDTLHGRDWKNWRQSAKINCSGPGRGH